MEKRFLMVVTLLVATLTAVNSQELLRTEEMINFRGAYLHRERTYENEELVREEYTLSAKEYPSEIGFDIFKRGSIQEIYETILELVDFESKYIDEEGVAKDLGDYKLFSGDRLITIWNGKGFVFLRKGKATSMKTKFEKYCEKQGIKLDAMIKR